MTETTQRTPLGGKQVTLIHESEFSKLVREIYGRPYQFQQQGDMMGQNTIRRFSVPAEPMGDHWQAVPLQEWLDATPPADEPGNFKERLRWLREFYPEMEDIVNDLHARGLIEKGDYALHIWW
jgi:hypothetical protein